MKDLKEGMFYYRKPKTYTEEQYKFNYLVFECVGFNNKGSAKTRLRGGFSSEVDANFYCVWKNAPHKESTIF